MSLQLQQRRPYNKTTIRNDNQSIGKASPNNRFLGTRPPSHNQHKDDKHLLFLIIFIWIFENSNNNVDHNKVAIVNFLPKRNYRINVIGWMIIVVVVWFSFFWFQQNTCFHFISIVIDLSSIFFSWQNNR